MWSLFEPLEGREMMSASPGSGTSVPRTPTIAATHVRADAAAPAGFTPAQRLRADRLISIFENSTMKIQYGYIERLIDEDGETDGRGYTAGRAGFTTATGDFLLVVERYTERVPANGLKKYLPRLRQLSAAGSESIDGLDGIKAAWKTAALDPAFRQVQDEVVAQEYYNPAVRRWKGLGLKKPLSLAAIYDTIIQHGEGDDPDGLPALIRRATLRAGGKPGVAGESKWLGAFLAERKKTLLHAFDPDTRVHWAASVDRVTVFQQLRAARNFDFAGPFDVVVYTDPFTVP
jgi:chitosanase